MAELVEPHGYPLEEHFVTTTDGFILRMFRIRHGVHGPDTHMHAPVALQHGHAVAPDCGASGGAAAAAAAAHMLRGDASASHAAQLRQCDMQHAEGGSGGGDAPSSDNAAAASTQTPGAAAAAIAL